MTKRMPFLKVLAAGVAAAVVASIPLSASAQFGWGTIVYDPSNYAKNTVTALQTAAQTAKQIQQYELQVQQYENQVQNTLQAPFSVYRLAASDIAGFQNDINGVTKLVPSGSMSAYLSKFTSGGGVSTSTNFCTTQGLCTSAQVLTNAQQGASNAQAQLVSQANGATTALTTLNGQATNLDQISKSCASAAVGSLQALGCQNQYAALQTNVLMQLAAIQYSQQQAAALGALQATQAAAQSDQAYNNGGATWNMGAVSTTDPVATFGQGLPGNP